MAGHKFHVQAVQRPGYDGFYREQRKWPSGAPTEITVLDQDEDPPRDPSKGVVIGRVTFEKLRAEPHLKISSPGDALEQAKQSAEVPALRSQVEALNTQIAALKEENNAQRQHVAHLEALLARGESAEAQAGHARQLPGRPAAFPVSEGKGEGDKAEKGDEQQAPAVAEEQQHKGGKHKGGR